MRSIRDNVAVGSPTAIFNTIPITATSPSVDTKGFNTAMLSIITQATGAVSVIGVGSSTTAVLQESPDNVTFSNALDNTGTAITATITATVTVVAASARIEGLGLNRQRYLRITLTSRFPDPANSPSALRHTLVAAIILGRAYADPTAAYPGGPLPQTPSNT